MLARGSQGGRIGVGRADRDAILRALLAAPGSTDADGRRGRGGEGGGGRASALASGDVRGASRGSGSSEAVAARARTRRPARSAEGAPGRGEEEDASSGMFERVHPAVDAARRPRGAGGGRPPPSTSTEAVRRAPCRGARRAPAQITSARRKGDTRRGGESGCRRLRSTLGIDAEIFNWETRDRAKLAVAQSWLDA